MKEKSQIVLRINNIIEQMGYHWIAIDSLALYLYEIKEDFNDIYVLVNEDYHEEIHNQFSKSFILLEGIKYQETKYYISNISSYLVDSFPVYLLSGLVIRVDKYVINSSFSFLLSSSISLPFYGIKILVPPLEWLFLYHLANPMKKDAIYGIIDKMKEIGINYNSLDLLLRNFSEDKKKEILELL